MNSYDLSCRYDSRQSFYGKARVEITTSPDLYVEKLYSYGTLVASAEAHYYLGQVEKRVYKYNGCYSQTTTRHQKEFFRQQGLNDKEIKELFKNGELTIEYSVDIPF